METTVGCECIKNFRHLTRSLPLSSICSFHLSTDQDCGNLSTISCMMMQSDAANQLFCSPLSFLPSHSLAEAFRSCSRPKVYSHLYSCAGGWFLAAATIAASPECSSGAVLDEALPRRTPPKRFTNAVLDPYSVSHSRRFSAMLISVPAVRKSASLHGDDACGNSVAAD